MATPKIYKDSTKRVLVAVESQSEERKKYPVIIVQLEGVIAYQSDKRQNSLLIRHNAIEDLHSLSRCYRIVLISELK